MIARFEILRICIVSVGKLKEKYLKDAIAEYRKRLSRYCSIEIIEVDDMKVPENLSYALEEKAKKTEADRIQKHIRQGSFVVAMDIKGETLSSEGFAKKIAELGVSGISDITFVIGGSLGIHEDITTKAHYKFSMSRLTFPHQLARLILIEQIYRAFKINSGEVYHK
jgi:23S rRNA (pseudouridine1915-N3)-methyltransferase